MQWTVIHQRFLCVIKYFHLKYFKFWTFCRVKDKKIKDISSKGHPCHFNFWHDTRHIWGAVALFGTFIMPFWYTVVRHYGLTWQRHKHLDRGDKMYYNFWTDNTGTALKSAAINRHFYKTLHIPTKLLHSYLYTERHQFNEYCLIGTDDVAHVPH